MRPEHVLTFILFYISDRQIPFINKTITYAKIPPLVKGVGIGLVPALIVGFASVIGLGDLVS